VSAAGWRVPRSYALTTVRGTWARLASSAWLIPARARDDRKSHEARPVVTVPSVAYSLHCVGPLQGCRGGRPPHASLLSRAALTSSLLGRRRPTGAGPGGLRPWQVAHTLIGVHDALVSFVHIPASSSTPDRARLARDVATTRRVAISALRCTRPTGTSSPATSHRNTETRGGPHGCRRLVKRCRSRRLLRGSLHDQRPCYARRLLRPVRISLIRISGCSKAAKCPPLSASP